MVSLYREAGDGAKEIGLLAVAGEMFDRLVDQEARLLAGTFGAKQRHECRLAGISVLAGALAGCGFIAAMIDEIVGDLKSQPDVARIAAIRRSGIVREPDHDAHRLDRIFDQRSGLELL